MTTTINNRYWATEHADMDWVTDRIAVGGGIFGRGAMAEVAEAGVTHVLSLAEFDETKLAETHGVAVCWNHAEVTELQAKNPMLRRGSWEGS